MLNQGSSMPQQVCKWVCSPFKTLRDLSSDRCELGRFLSLFRTSLMYERTEWRFYWRLWLSAVDGENIGASLSESKSSWPCWANIIISDVVFPRVHFSRIRVCLGCNCTCFCWRLMGRKAALLLLEFGSNSRAILHTYWYGNCRRGGEDGAVSFECVLGELGVV